MALAAMTACGGLQVSHEGSFWMRAAGDPTIKVAPGRTNTTPGVTITDTFEGKVTLHQRASGSAADHVLALARAGGDEVRLYYRIGGARAIPVQVGDQVRMKLLQRRHAEDEGMDVGLMIWRWQATATVLAPTPLGAGNKPVAGALRGEELMQLVTVVQTRDIISVDDVPQVLAALRKTDIPAYHESGTYRGVCEEIRAHHHFRITRPQWVKERADSGDERLLAPGTNVVLDDGRDRFGVHLMDNRVVKRDSSTCKSVPEPTWSWSAIRVARPAPELATNMGPNATPQQPRQPQPDPSKTPNSRPAN